MDLVARVRPSLSSPGPSYLTSLSSRTKYNTFKSPIELQQLHELQEPIDWPIVRLDNVRSFAFSPAQVCEADVETALSRSPGT